MAAVSAPAPRRRSLIGAVAGIFTARARAKGGAGAAAAAKAARENVLTVAGLGAGVGDAWMHGGSLWGLGALAVGLLLFDFKLYG